MLAIIHFSLRVIRPFIYPYAIKHDYCQTLIVKVIRVVDFICNFCLIFEHLIVNNSVEIISYLL